MYLKETAFKGKQTEHLFPTYMYRIYFIDL